MTGTPDGHEPWNPTTFFIATSGGAPVEVYGYMRRGLALFNKGWATPRTKTAWTLTHMGSGAAVLKLIGTVSMVMPVAGDIADCSDWTLFDLPEGWKQTDPDLMAKVDAICEAHPEVQPDRSFSERISVEDARAVMEARDRLAGGM